MKGSKEKRTGTAGALQFTPELKGKEVPVPAGQELLSEHPEVFAHPQRCLDWFRPTLFCTTGSPKGS